MLMLSRAGRNAFSPLSIPGLALWLDASRLTLADLDPVTTWLDLSDNGRNATQATLAKKPTFRTNMQNGKPVVEFDGVDDTLATAAFSSALAQPNTVVFAAQRLVQGTGNAAFFDSTVAYQHLFRGLVNWDIYAGATFLTINNANNNAHVWSAVFNTTSSTFQVDSVVVSGSVGTGVLSGVTLGSVGGGADPLNCRLFEVAVYDTLLTNTELARLQTYLKLKWGTP